MKKSSGSKNPSVTSKGKLDLAGFMIKIQEQLAILERKIDGWIGQIPAKSVEVEAQPGPVSPALPSSRPAGALQGRGHRERVLHKAVCADCHKDCEIPFKPSGERPVYCKPCFSKRKSGGHAKPSPGPGRGAVPQKETVLPVQQARQVSVTKKGVGKVTVSEIVRPGRGDSRRKRK